MGKPISLFKFSNYNGFKVELYIKDLINHTSFNKLIISAMTAGQPQTTQKKIMIVEDEVPLRKALSSKFTREGYFTIEAEDGKDALGKALENHPDIIIADIFMPEMTGLEFVQKLREDSWGLGAQIIFLTNLNNTEEVMKAMEYGVEDYMVKADMRLEDIVGKVKEKLGEEVVAQPNNQSTPQVIQTAPAPQATQPPVPTQPATPPVQPQAQQQAPTKPVQNQVPQQPSAPQPVPQSPNQQPPQPNQG